MTLEGSKFDIAKYSWLGSTAVEGTVLTVRQDLPYRTITDLLKMKTPIVLGCTGPMDPGSQFPNLLKEFAGLNATLITYPSSADVMLAIERKEVDGRAGAYSSLKPFIDRGLVRPLVRGPVAEKGMENLPVNTDFTTDKKGKTIMGVFSVADLIGRPYVAPPKTPAAIMNILTTAFAKMGESPELQADAEKVGMGIKYTSGKEVLKAITSAFNQPQEIMREFSKYMKYQK
jgi:tripartite-type tricarboxylate transporter receptor subunit TctC